MPGLPDVFELEFEPPDLVSLKVRGNIEAEHASLLFDRIDELVAGKPFWMLEVDISRLASAEAQTRRVGADRLARLSPYSMTVYGGGFAQRTVARLFFRAVELLFRDRGNHHKICIDQRESRAWLATEAERHRTRSSRAG
jgi:hypothetical protein